MKYTIIFVLMFTSYARVSLAESPFSANDLSILFPLNDHKSMKYNISITTKDWAVVPSHTFKMVIESARAQDTFINSKLEDPRNWMLVAIRFTPCNHLAGELLKCSEQIRFVYQPINALQDDYGLDDYALHVLYVYGATEEAKISPRLESFRELKNEFPANMNKPLQINPILTSTSGELYVNALRRKVVDKHIVGRQPTKITFMGLKNIQLESDIVEPNRDQWIFFSGDVDSEGSWNLTLLPTSAKHKSQIFTADSEVGLLSSIKVPKSKFSLFGKSDSIGNAMSILNPLISNDHNVDCASCHIADRYIFPPIIDNNSEFFDKLTWMTNNQPRISEVLIDKSIHVGRRASEFPIPRIFGYLATTPSVSQRVVMDTALATKIANQLYSIKEERQCNPDTNEKVMLCLYINSMSLQSCLEKYCDMH